MTWPHIDILLRGRFQFTVSLENLFFNQHTARRHSRPTDRRMLAGKKIEVVILTRTRSKKSERISMRMDAA